MWAISLSNFVLFIGLAHFDIKNIAISRLKLYNDNPIKIELASWYIFGVQCIANGILLISYWYFNSLHFGGIQYAIDSNGNGYFI